VQLLTDELTQKQAMVERLIGEIDRHSEALRSCGEEIVSLRREKAKAIDTQERLAEKLGKISVARAAKVRGGGGGGGGGGTGWRG